MVAAPPATGGSHPFRVVAFRRLWALTIVANLAALVQTVGAAWLMTQTGTAVQVALIQSAIAFPVMAFALVAGTLADIADRMMLLRMSFALMVAGAGLLAVAAQTGWATPPILLAMCAMFGCGSALFGPTGMAVVGDHVPREIVPEAVASLGVAFNIARCIGPAIGGAVVALMGAGNAFAINAAACALSFLLLRDRSPARLAGRERLPGALAGAVRFALSDPSVRRVMLQATLYTASASPIWALLPLLARDRLGGGSGTYGLLMSALGVGATALAMGLRPLRRRFDQAVLRNAAIGATAVSLILLAVAPDRLFAIVPLFVAGGGWAASLTLWNVAAQTNAPPNLTGRAIGAFYTAVFTGLAAGSWGWGFVAEHRGLAITFLAAGIVTALPALVGTTRLLVTAVKARSRKEQSA